VRQTHANRLGILAVLMGVLFVVAPMVLGPWWPLAPAVVFVVGYFYAMHCGFQRMVRRAQAEVSPAREDAPEPLPPVSPMEVRDPAFQARERLLRHSVCCSQSLRVKVGPLIAERGFTAVRDCPAGHVAAHWIGEFTERDGRELVERTCRFTACGKTWMEPR
jgi:hypothetical protein